MSNKIRYYMEEQVSEILPFLHETYMRIGRFQKKRSARNETLLTACLDDIGPRLQVFRGAIQTPKQPYFDVLLRRDLDISDRIIALDTAVGAMHIEFSVPRMYSHQESQELKLALEQCRQTDDVVPALDVEAGDANVLCRGIPASPGIACGQVYLWTTEIDHRKIPDRCILVSTMTRPEIAVSLGRVNGVVTDIGGRLSHAAIIALERGVPCVVGTKNATDVLTPSLAVCVDGDAGLVYAPTK